MAKYLILRKGYDTASAHALSTKKIPLAKTTLRSSVRFKIL